MIHLNELSAGKNPPDEINVVIEITKGSNIKYEMDSETGALFVDRILSTSMSYPCNYGFIPKTKEQDVDPVDVFVLACDPVVVMSVIRCQPVGILLTEDQDGQDSKILAIPLVKVDSNSSITDVGSIPEHTLNQLKHFIEHHKDLEEGKYVRIKGLEGRQVAKKKISEAIVKYNKNQV
ncbi:MAG: inorganic diphosphatase [Nitrososphaeraceae archaeon]|nr:inorganic diphosphatase [Nitrososphaeraceae archaeon]